MQSLLQSVRVAVRSLLRTPAFTLTAIVTLGLGIGLTTAVFTVADALLLRRLPVRDQDRLIVLSGETRDHRIDNYPLGLEDAREFSRNSRTLARVALFTFEGATARTLRDGSGTVRVRRSLVSGNFFSVLDARPLLGRVLRPEDDEAGALPVLVLSYRGWHEHFAGAADVIGKRLVMQEDGMSYTVVGVMPQGLDYPRGTDAWAAVLAVTPKAIAPFINFDLVGRLAAGSTPTRARDEMTGFLTREGHPPWQRKLRGAVHTLPDLVLGDARPAVLALGAATALLLLITCVNVANLLLVRGLARAREIAVRTALGATRGRIVAQLLVEHALLAVVGGAFGLLLAAWAVRGFVILAPAGLPRLDEIHLNVTALAGALGVTGLAMLVFGLAPAILTSRVEAQQVLWTGMRQSQSRRTRLTSEGLVVGQLAIALLVLSAAALVGRSFVKLERADLKFEPSGLLIGELALRYDLYDTAPKQVSLLDRLLPQVAAIPGVLAVSPVVAAPFATVGWDGNPALEGQSAEEAAANPMLNMELVGSRYFAALGIPVLRGRGFTDEDRAGAPAVVVLSQTAAQHYWPNAEPLGKRLTMGAGSKEPSFTVVGVVPDTRYRDLRKARASIYFPLQQSFFPFAPTALAIRTRGSPAAVVPALRRVLHETTPDVELASVRQFEDLLAGPLAQPRLNALLLVVFAGAAVAVSAVGLFAVMAVMVRQRTREFGVRMALGATTAAVSALVLRRGMTLAATGTALGLLGALTLNRLLAAILFDVSPTDARTLGFVAIVLLVVAALASIIPTLSSTKIQPVVALRAE